jgi:hypothetical protein
LLQAMSSVCEDKLRHAQPRNLRRSHSLDGISPSPSSSKAILSWRLLLEMLRIIGCLYSLLLCDIAPLFPNFLFLLSPLIKKKKKMSMRQ